MYKSTNGICSHTLLAASLSGEVNNFVNPKSEVPVNYANLAQHGLPVGGKNQVPDASCHPRKPWQQLYYHMSLLSPL